MIVAIKRAKITALTPMQRRGLKHGLRLLSFGQPAPYEQPNGKRWSVYDDHRIDLYDVARIAALFNNLNQIPDNLETDNTRAARRRLRQRIVRIMDRRVVPWVETFDSPAPNEVIALQGVAANAMRAGDIGNLTPKENN